MKRPQDPRNHGLKEPQKNITKFGGIEFAVYRHTSGNAYKQLSLETIVAAWDKALKDHLNQGHRISAGPLVKCSYDFLEIEYSYEFDNLNYSVEKAEFDATMAAYLEDLKRYEEEEAKKKDGPPPGIDEKIERAERRLANLKAHKAGEPLPYPDG